MRSLLQAGLAAELVVGGLVAGLRVGTTSSYLFGVFAEFIASNLERAMGRSR